MASSSVLNLLPVHCLTLLRALEAASGTLEVAGGSTGSGETESEYYVECANPT